MTTSNLRCVKCEQGLLTKPDGSASYTQGDTSVIAAIYGPGEIQSMKENVDRSTVEVVFKRKQGLTSCAEKFQERILRNTCQTALMANLHPRSLVNIILQEVNDSGSFLACCVNATCLALLDSAISMKYMIAGVSCIVDQDNSIIIDPTSSQEENATCGLTFVFDSVDYSILTVSTRRSYTNEQFQSCLLACREASKFVFQFYRETMKKKLSKEF